MKNLLLTFVLVFTTLFTNTWAEDNPRAVIIFDASGSMWGQIEGKTKIEIARDALKNVVQKWNPSVELGLTVYGHRTKGDCDDIETVIPVGKIDKNRVIKTVMSIKPKGKTPISRSLRKVANEIKYTEEKATIILISDGKETCDPDPCGTAKALEKDGIDFVTHVIGFNVDKKTSQQLECIADATGGEYFSAKNATALNDAMKVIVKKVEKVEPKPIPKPKVKKLDINLEVTASEKEGGKWIGAYNSIYQVEDGKAGERVGTVHSYKKKAGTSQLPVGKYILKSTYNDFKKETAFEIKAGEVAKVHVVMGETGTVEVTASEKEGGKWIGAYNSIYQLEDGKAGERVGTVHSYKKKAGTNQLPVGKYILKSTYNDFKKETAFEIKAGEVTKVHIVMGETGTVEVTASEKEGGKWIGAYNSIYQLEDGKAGERVGTVHSYKKKAGKAQIPVGKYIVKSTYNDFEVLTPIEVKAGEVTKIHVVMGQTGTIETSASEKEGGKWIAAYHNIVQDEDGKAGDLVARAHSQKKNVGKRQIPVGKYILKSTYNDFKKETAFEIKAGEVTKVHVVMGETGTVEVSASEKEGGKWIAAYHNIVQDEDGKAGDLVSRANSQKKSAGKAQIPVGRYIIESSYKSFKKETPVEIKAGETTKVHVTFGQFFIEAKCTNMGDKINYEIYANSGQLVYEKKMTCSDRLKVTLDNGDYSVEAKVGNDIKTVKFTVDGANSKLLVDMTDIKKGPTKEELIKADSLESVKASASITEEQKSEKITLGDKQIEIKGLSQEDAEKFNELGAMLGALGGMMQGTNPEDKREEKQSADNAKADKEFDDMSKELDMFTK